MIFESLWPLALLAAVPVVIILYLLKPRGKDYRISSNLLWRKLLKNQQSKTFFEKFVQNILMYLQILIILLLVLALMSPYINREGVSNGNVILVFDTSASMQHDSGSGRTRMEAALQEAKSLITASEGTAFSIVTSDCTGTELLAVGTTDKNSLYDALEQVACCDGEGNLTEAESVVDTLRGAEEDSDAQVIVFTDGNGAEDAAGFAEYFSAQILVMGDAVSNVSNNFLSYTADGDGYVIASSVTNYSDSAAIMEISLYEGEKLLTISSAALEAGETTLCYFDDVNWQGGVLRSEISSVRFEGSSSGDSLAADNVAYAVGESQEQVDVVLVGSGNTYIEKAYQAAFGESLTKTESESVTVSADTVYIYDADAQELQAEETSRMVFGDSTDASGTQENVMLTVSDCDLTDGLSDFTIGVNVTNLFEVPDWGYGFLWSGDACAGYYGEHDGIKVIAIGFDIRESDFPLMAEFPVFISNAIQFLSDTSLLAKNTYEVGEDVVFHPQADLDVSTLETDTSKAGLYEVSTGEVTESYVVRFAADSQSDGRITAEGTSAELSYSRQLVKKRLRNVLLVIILILMIIEWVVYVRQMRYHGRFYRVVRIVGLAMLVLAVLGVKISIGDGTNTTIFLVDLSDSNEQNLSDMEAYIEDALDQMPADNQYGIVAFGKNSLVEQFLTEETYFSQIMSLPDQTATNFEEAVSRALAMIPADCAGRIVILTDGKQTRGDITSTASALVSRQIELLAVTYETTEDKDAYIDDVELPAYLYQGDAYSMTVTVESNYETDAQIQILNGSMLTESYEVHLNRGTNQFQFQQQVTGESIESYEVKVVAKDTCEENNSYHAYAVVESEPKLLVVSGMDEDSTAFEEILQSAGCNYSIVSAINAADTLEEMLAYKSIILENVYLSDLPEGFLDNIETYVKDYGCGLICCGGEDSYALGGYKDSVLETLLPVDMELKGVDETPATAMIMVIDHSGSMSNDAGSGATNLDLAVAAAEAAVDQMNSTDYVGVLTFDDQYSWVVEPTLAADKEAIKAQIETIAEGGGTTIKPALQEALSKVLECDADIRHVVLLTDGQGETRNFKDLTAAYTDAAVTLSAVAVGDGSDTSLLEMLAENCGGRYYYSDIATDIPKIFAQEVFLSGDTYLQNGEFTLAVSGSSEITGSLFADGWPILYGYVSATAKNAASVLIASEKDDPILSVMQYGLGHTVAWNTDVTNEWTAAFAGQDDYVQMWKRIIGYATGNTGIGEDSIDVTTAGGYTDITYTALDYSEQTEVEAVYTDPDGNTYEVQLKAVAPGQFKTKLDTDLSGVYNLNVRRVDDGEIINVVTVAAVVQYSDEYKFDADTDAFTQFVEHYGTMITPQEDFWKQLDSKSRQQYELAKWLILMALLWFVMDIAFRRFHFLPQDTGLYRLLSERYSSHKTEDETGEKPVQVNDAPVTEAAEKENTGKMKKKKKTAEKQAPQSLDTSALLKKKDQRNQ